MINDKELTEEDRGYSNGSEVVSVCERERKLELI